MKEKLIAKIIKRRLVNGCKPKCCAWVQYLKEEMMEKDLGQILKFKNDAVIKRFARDYPEYAENSEVIFEDLMRFFWISKKHRMDKLANPKNLDFQFSFIMDEEMKIIDTMWHVFLLYTKGYMDFCEEFFGEYIHHLPDIVPNMPQNPSAFKLNLERFLSYTYDILGEKTVKRWFAEV